MSKANSIRNKNLHFEISRLSFHASVQVLILHDSVSAAHYNLKCVYYFHFKKHFALRDLFWMGMPDTEVEFRRLRLHQSTFLYQNAIETRPLYMDKGKTNMGRL